MADQDSLFDNIEDTELQGLRLSPEVMDFHRGSVDGEEEQRFQDTAWEQHHNIPDIPLTAVAQQREEELAPCARAISGAAFSLQSECRPAATSFVNPFFPVSEDGRAQYRAAECDQDVAGDLGAGEAVDHVFCEWNPFTPHMVTAPAPGMFGPRAASHQQVLGSVYTDLGSQISRRLSLAYPTNGTYEIPLPGIPQVATNLQFVIEDPAGRENIARGRVSPVLAGSEQGRRHSVGSSHLYCCPWTGCNKVFNRFYNLRSHYRIHSGEKPFTCNFCDASFARNHDLKRHERIHLKTKPFACPTCNKTFSRNDAMNRHTRLNSCSRPNA